MSQLNQVPRGSICGFQYWSTEDNCWKPRVAIVVKRSQRADGTWRSLCLDLGQGAWRTFLEPHARDVRVIYVVAAEKTEEQARAFADGFREGSGPEWLVWSALADSARVVHGFGQPHAVIATRKGQKVA